MRPTADIVKSKKQDAESCSDDASDRDEPAPGEGLVEHGRRAIELLARRQQQEHKKQQESRFAKCEALEEREDETQGAQGKGEFPGAVAAVEQAARDEQKDHADQTSEEVGTLHRP